MMKIESMAGKAIASRKAGKPVPGGRPRPPRNQLTGQHQTGQLIQWSPQSNHRPWYKRCHLVSGGK